MKQNGERELNREPISQSFGFGVGPHTNEMFHPSPLNTFRCFAIATPPFLLGEFNQASN
jgi:hypothetical protein